MPVIKFDKPSGSTGNKGSCADICNYLEKEDSEKGLEKEFFFNHKVEMIPSN
jgi:hypothetical protein